MFGGISAGQNSDASNPMIHVHRNQTICGPRVSDDVVASRRCLQHVPDWFLVDVYRQLPVGPVDRTRNPHGFGFNRRRKQRLDNRY